MIRVSVVSIRANRVSTGAVAIDTETIQKVYNSYAVFYDLLFGLVTESGRVSAIKRLKLRPGQKVLEVGVGTGLSFPAFPSSSQIKGIDLSEKMLQQAQKKIDTLNLSHITIEKMDASRMTFADDTFDAVFAAYVITTVPDPLGVLSEIKRVCKKGSTIVLVNHFKSDIRGLSFFETAISPFCSKHLGFKTDFSISLILNDSELRLIDKKRLSPISFWEVAEFQNMKSAGSA